MKFLKNRKNLFYILIIWVVVLITLLIGCKPQQSPQYTSTSDIHEDQYHEDHDDTLNTVATAAVVGAATAYGTNKYIDYKKQQQTKSKPFNNSVKNKPSNLYRSTKSYSKRRK